MNNFITNAEEKTLADRLKTLISRSSEMKFLVGFFYFSGIREFYEQIKEKYEQGNMKEEHLKILVGLSLDKNIWQACKIACETPNLQMENKEQMKNTQQIKNEFFQSIEIFLNSAEFDNEQIYEQFEFFVKLIKERKIVIRKTHKPNHAKLYIFKFDDKITPCLFITGSSNLTNAGLRSQYEFNVEIKDYGFKEAEEYFDKFWKESVEITIDDFKKIEEEIINVKTFLRKITPYEAYAYILKTYINLYRGQVYEDIKSFMESKGYKPYRYQLEAVSQAVENCKNHGGVILADVVGLGKTIIACLVAKKLGLRGIVICPPHLEGDENKNFGWKKYIEDFELYNWEVRSLGKLEEVLEFVKNKNFDVVIVDEAHRFRNEETKRYHFLREICRGKIVILLTATPFNNRPSDIFALLKLFTIPKKSTIVYDGNLSLRFYKYETDFEKLSYILRYYNSSDNKKKERVKSYYQELFKNDQLDLQKVQKRIEKIANEIRSIIEPVTIRRNRLDLKYYNEKIDFPTINDPEQVFFELTKEQSQFYDEVVNYFLSYDEGGEFTGAIYLPEKYEIKDKNQQNDEDDSFLSLFQRNLYDFMRRLLVKRFESSFGAFYESIKRFINTYQNILDFIHKTEKFILDKDRMEEIMEDPDKIQEKLEEYETLLKQSDSYNKYQKIYNVNKMPNFVEDIEKDKKLFEYIKKRFEELELTKSDPKAEKLVQIIKNIIESGRKVVVFTEYIDTANYIQKILEENFGSKLLAAVGNISKSTIEAIYANFDAQYKNQENRFDILLTTDKLSEGFNLNRAGAVINYDIPWNPVRVIQRVGRINRIGKKVYDEIYIYNFFPTEKGADIVKSREIAEQKMFAIHKVLGEDSKIFSPQEEPKPSELYKRLTTFSEIEKTEQESLFSKILAEYEKIKNETPEIEKKIEYVPNRVKVSKPADKNELVVFIKRGKDIFVAYKDYKEPKHEIVSFENVFEKIKATKETPLLPLSQKFWQNYKILLDKTSYLSNQIWTKSGQPNKLQDKAKNALQTIIRLQKNFPDQYRELEKYQDFLASVIEDIRNYGTLSKYILLEICDLEKYKEKPEKLLNAIEKIGSKISYNLIEKIKELEQNEEIIIAVEGRGNEEENMEVNKTSER